MLLSKHWAQSHLAEVSKHWPARARGRHWAQLKVPPGLDVRSHTYWAPNSTVRVAETWSLSVALFCPNNLHPITVDSSSLHSEPRS
jgi:hypothetical protein